jgi:TPR repeat protein
VISSVSHHLFSSLSFLCTPLGGQRRCTFFVRKDISGLEFPESAKAADADNAQAMSRLGLLYRNGWGVAQDYRLGSLRHFSGI